MAKSVAEKYLTIKGLLSEVVAQTYPCWWLPPTGGGIKCRHHVEGGVEILRRLGRPLPEDSPIGDVYGTLYKLGYARVMLSNVGMDAGFHVEHGGSLTADQKSWLLEQSKERKVPAFDDNTGRVLFAKHKPLG